MKSRMDKYYQEELMQRTSKNDFLYDELYKEKRPSSNVTILDNINEIDITKIKAMVDSRERHSKMRSYEDILNSNESKKTNEIDYQLDEVDNSNYDINEVLKKKRTDNVYEDSSKIRKLASDEYDTSTSSNEDMSEEFLTHEKQLKDLFNTVSRTVVDENDLFANLKDEEDETAEENEQIFYTNTSKIDSVDFEDVAEVKGNSKVFIIIGILALLVAVGIIVYIKFIK
ncbi:MAG: hypothetical protein II119_00940 [Bacilli bacterium]|nr:hypothetical protein [Bacilli bacterium]MBQ6282765.1 hypothetical protein [Bacilli bacterium]